MTSEALLEVSDLAVDFPLKDGKTVHAVQGVSFEIAAGETLGLVGESGSGKSTVGFTVMRRYLPTSGRVIFEGRDLAQLSNRDLRRMRRDVQIIFQDPYSSLNSRMRVGDIVAEPLLIHDIARGRAARIRAEELLEMCGLPASSAGKYPSSFSGGERQRIAIARSLALRPKLIVADEAVSALDVSIQAQIINLLTDIQQQEGVSYLFITHNLAIVRHIAHRLMIMYGGQVMEVGPTAEVFAAPRNPYTQALLSAAPIADPTVERARERIVLSGEVPSVVNLPTGCIFQSRCPLVMDRCRVERPPLRPQPETGRSTACWRPEDVPLMLERPESSIV